MDADQHRQWATRLDGARALRKPIERISMKSGLDRDDAYSIQRAGLALRRERGEGLRGVKVGMTSRERAAMLGLPYSGPALGLLTDAMAVDDVLRLDGYIAPRAEPEIVFCLEHALRGPGVTARDVMAATSWVACGIEIIDSSFIAFDFQVEDSIADNSSSAGYSIGTRLCSVEDAGDLDLIGCVVEIDGEVVASGAGAAVLGHPARSVAFAANDLGGRGDALEAGSVVFTGAIANAIPLAVGAVMTVEFARLGAVHLAVASNDPSATETAH